MNKFLLEIVTPARKVFEEEVTQVNAPTMDGVVGILAHHAPLLTALKEGEIKIVTEEKEFYLAVGGGFMEVGNNKARILVAKAMYADELNEAEIQKAMAAAKEVIANKGKGNELREAQAVMRRSIWELSVLKRRTKNSYS